MIAAHSATENHRKLICFDLTAHIQPCSTHVRMSSHRLTSCRHVCCDEDLLLAVPEALYDGSTLLHVQLAAQQCHRVTFVRHLLHQPARRLPRLRRVMLASFEII